jgi:hypothetical protein
VAEPRDRLAPVGNTELGEDGRHVVADRPGRDHQLLGDLGVGAAEADEIQDNSGATDDGTVAADQTLKKLISDIEAAGGPSYTARSTRSTIRTAASRAATSAPLSCTTPIASPSSTAAR